MNAQGQLFPLWQPGNREYSEICAYLEITPQPHLYRKLTDYLAEAPFRFVHPGRLYLHLARHRLTRFRIARMDLASKLFFPNAPIRHIINAIIALHECDGDGYREISAAPSGAAVIPSLAGEGIRFAASLVITSGWLGWNLVTYLAGSPFRPRTSLSGKVVLVTGASRGLGLDLMLQALQQGAEVVATVRNHDSYRQLDAQLPPSAPVKLLVADLSVPEALSKSLETENIDPASVDIAIACAGIKLTNASIMDQTSVRKTFEVNYFSAVELAGWLFKSGSKSTLVVISSIGRWHGMHSTCGYNASKAALSIWGESLEMELQNSGKHNSRIMIVEPGIFESGMMKQGHASRFLYSSRQDLATRIISDALRGKKVLRYPYWFALLTWSVCMGGRRLRNHVFSSNQE